MPGDVEINAWFNADEKPFPELARAISREYEGRSTTQGCGEKSPLESPECISYVCTRPVGHRTERHIAVGTEVVAAWPGVSEPTLDDLTLVRLIGGEEDGDTTALIEELEQWVNMLQPRWARSLKALEEKERELDERTAERDAARATAAKYAERLAVLEGDIRWAVRKLENLPATYTIAHPENTMRVIGLLWEDTRDVAENLRNSVKRPHERGEGEVRDGE